MTALSPFHSRTRAGFHILGESTSIYNRSHTQHITCMCITHISHLSIQYHMHSYNTCVHAHTHTHIQTTFADLHTTHSTLRRTHHSQVCPPRCLSSMNCLPEPSQPSGGGIPQENPSIPREQTTGPTSLFCHSQSGQI